jgi:long-chain acyl-CoA synthetase
MLSEFLANKGNNIKSGKVNWQEILKENIEITINPKKIWMKIFHLIIRPLIILYFRLKMKGLENLPEEPFIIAPNHQSFMDVILLSAALPEKVLYNTFFIAKDSLKKSRMIKFFMDKTNVIYINLEKDIREAILKSAAVLKSGKNLVIFPEGHRSRDGRVGKFKKAFAILSRELNIPVIPLAIKGAFEALPIKKIIPKPVKIELTFLNPGISPKDDYDVIMEKVRNIIIKNVEKNKGGIL